MTAPDGDVLVERHGHVMLVRLNRPHRHNAIGGTILRDLAAAFGEAADDDDVHVVVTTGAGDSFCVGADAAELAGGARPPARELLSGDRIGGETGLPPLTERQRSADRLGNAGRWTERMWALEKPTIAAVNGPAVGGGFGVALLHDVLIAGASARLGTGFAPIGLSPELGISLLLPRIVGLSAAAELLFTGRLLDASEARELKLVSRVVPDEELLERAMELAARIAAMPPLGVLAAKRLLRASFAGGMTDQLQAEYASHLVLFDHPDTHAAMDALAERLASGRRDRSGASTEVSP
ncbi:enoyl-CoA hydratase/isomerase family protein [Actinomadura livida]|uniref:Enoyl-CoA hydratase/carnithine racemase n=1 Tax=Actinomadura livida TaxID=79909 RepID=A0A7W7MYG5_9ACTN|nr:MULTISPECIES: enoyl-CoA hydratase/isomerase family protein [Actinomadura]MBB4774832.1 enoyl-CoA hydratase/carnithine racemase [Actinomadura catellatispora]GGU05703.1 enoyl-CoA hydratase [Actinomadura livida]